MDTRECQVPDCFEAGRPMVRVETTDGAEPTGRVTPSGAKRSMILCAEHGRGWEADSAKRGLAPADW